MHRIHSDSMNRVSQMKIPAKFNLLGQTITVKIDNCPNPPHAGQSFFHENKIVLYKKSSKNREILEQTFLHEVMHFVFFYINTVDPIKLKNDVCLCNDESTVDLSASLFHQVLKSGKIVK